MGDHFLFCLSVFSTFPKINTCYLSTKSIIKNVFSKVINNKILNKGNYHSEELTDATGNIYEKFL